MKKLTFLFAFIILLGCLSFPSMAQFSPTFQNAGSVGKGNAELTLGYSNIGFAFQGESQNVYNNYVFQAGFGVSPLTEIRLKYDRSNFKNGDGIGFNGWMIGPKFSSESRKFAFYLPTGITTSSISNNRWIVEPTFIFSFPLGEKVDFNLSPSYLLYFANINPFIEEDLVKLNLGLGIDLSENWVIRPEAGLLFFKEDFNAYYFNFGLGISRRILKAD